MIFIAIVGNLFLYFQAYVLLKQKKTILSSNEGSTIRLASYTYSVVCSFFWIIYAGLHQNWVVLISSTIAITGSTLCVIILMYYQHKNKRPIVLSSDIENDLLSNQGILYMEHDEN